MEKFTDLYYDIMESDFMKRKVHGDLVIEMTNVLGITEKEFTIYYNRLIKDTLNAEL